MSKRILEVETEHTAPFKTLIEVLSGMLTETVIEFTCSNPEKQYKKEDKKEDKKVDKKEDKKVDKKVDKKNTKNKKDDVDDEENDDEEKEDNEDNEDDEENDDGDDGDKNEKKEDAANKDDPANKDGMRIMAVDPSKTVLINMKLKASQFSKFICLRNKISIGINLVMFYKLIKTLGKNDIITLYIEQDDKNKLMININNADENKNSTLELKLLDLDEEKLSIPDITFDAVITMQSSEFHKLCREMSQLSEHLEITCIKNKITFSGKGASAGRTTNYSTDTDNDKQLMVNINHGSIKDPKLPQIVQGIYELKNLVLFSKCTTLCKDIQIYMKNNYPLVIRYKVATLGHILLCLVPIDNNVMKNTTYDDEDKLYNEKDDDNVEDE